MEDKLKVLVNLGKFSRTPTQGYEGDFAWDLYSDSQKLVLPNMFQSKLISTGLQTAFDETKAGMFLSMRSGAASRTPLMVANSPGIVEGTYRNDIQVLVRNTYSEIHSRPVDYVLHLKGKEVVQVPVGDVQRGALDEAKQDYIKNLELFGGQWEELPDQVKEMLFKIRVPRGTMMIDRYDRIAQMSFIPKMEVDMELASPEHGLPESVRGENGMGSSGSS